MATKRGDPEQTVGNTEKAKGIGSPYYKEKIGEQKADVSDIPFQRLGKAQLEQRPWEYHGKRCIWLE